MSTAAIFGVISALVTTFSAAKPTGVDVFDGPDVSALSSLECVVVGSDDGVPGDYRSGREDQVYANIGAVSKDARGQVACSVICQGGASEVPERRTRAQAILTTLENALRANIDLGGAALYTGISNIELRQQSTRDGAVVRIVFIVTYRARI